MGDPRRLKKKYSTPVHPWQKENIEVEGRLAREYGLRNKKEQWKIASLLKGFKDQAKRLIAARTVQAEREKKQLMQRLQKLGLIQAGARLDDILGLEIKNIMERRLQSLVFRKGLASSMKQARQFIVHQHIKVGERKVTIPGYVVSQAEEEMINFDSGSRLSNPEHPERALREEKEKKEEVKGKKEEKKKGKKKTKSKEGRKVRKKEEKTKAEEKGEETNEKG